ncbi:hypothetical protein V2J09_016586 [Rumex salicifolius]
MGFKIDPSFIQPPERRSATTTTTVSSSDEIPIIDLSTTDTGNLAAEIGAACADWGFFQVVNHGVPAEKRERVETEARRFFEMPPEEKAKVRRTEADPLGYYDSEHTKNVRDWKEVFDFNAADPVLISASPDSDDCNLRELRSQWPQFPPHFREACQDYIGEMVKLSYKLLELIALSLDLPPNRLHGAFEHQTSFARLNYYPPCHFPDVALGVGPHKDSSVFTVLAQDGVSGLQVRRKSDAQWILVNPTPDAFIINVGDVLQVWSNDKYDSVEHRVKANGDKERLSIPFFFDPSHYVEVKPLKELVNEDNPPKYKGYKYGKFYSSRRLSDFKKLNCDNIQIHHFKV